MSLRRAGDGKTILLCVTAVGPWESRSHCVLVYAAGHGETVLFQFPLGSTDIPNFSAGATAPIRRVDAHTMTALGEAKDSAYRSVQHEQFRKAHPEFGDLIPVPNCEFAVGLLRTDGLYTNFVPVDASEVATEEPDSRRAQD